MVAVGRPLEERGGAMRGVERGSPAQNLYMLASLLARGGRHLPREGAAAVSAYLGKRRRPAEDAPYSRQDDSQPRDETQQGALAADLELVARTAGNACAHASAAGSHHDGRFGGPSPTICATERGGVGIVRTRSIAGAPRERKHSRCVFSFSGRASGAFSVRWIELLSGLSVDGREERASSAVSRRVASTAHHLFEAAAMDGCLWRRPGGASSQS
ncbi:hypothetical protein T492DRAFT_904638 [Pavlovales sp. CCMP2436]|nr:hypothetical protein T492DRAFT_904638 [Pavlovales sp. CCMP2436]